MANDRIDTRVVFNFTFKSAPGGVGRSAGAGGPVTGRASNFATASIDDKPVYSAVNYSIQQIAFVAGKRQQTAIQRALNAKFQGIVATELGNMGRKISSTGIGLGPYSQAKFGATTLELSQNPAMAMQGFTAGPHQPVPMRVGSVSGNWRDRTTEYLNRKRRKYGHAKWWLNTGELRNALTNPGLWTSVYGPVNVRWEPQRITQDPFIARISNLARGRGRPVSLNTPRGEVLSIGTIHMSIMGRITRDMLNDPGKPAFNSRFSGLFDAMPDDVEAKLTGRWGPRVLVEPFLTFYINRQIPNRIFNAIEKSVTTQSKV